MPAGLQICCFWSHFPHVFIPAWLYLCVYSVYGTNICVISTWCPCERDSAWIHMYWIPVFIKVSGRGAGLLRDLPLQITPSFIRRYLWFMELFMHEVTRWIIRSVTACSHGSMHGSHKNFIPVSTTFAAQHGLNKPTAPSLVYLHIRLIAKYKMRCIKIESSCFWACSSHVRMQRVISTRKH